MSQNPLTPTCQAFWVRSAASTLRIAEIILLHNFEYTAYEPLEDLRRWHCLGQLHTLPILACPFFSG
jgi:hypothetical protein